MGSTIDRENDTESKTRGKKKARRESREKKWNELIHASQSDQFHRSIASEKRTRGNVMERKKKKRSKKAADKIEFRVRRLWFSFLQRLLREKKENS